MAASVPLPLHIDSTMISCFRSCPQKFFKEFVHGFRPKQISVDLHAGACFASGLEDVYRGMFELGLDFPNAMQRAHGRFGINWGNFEVPEWKKTAKNFDRTWEAVEGYFIEWPPHTDHVQPYFAADGKATFEYTFAIPLEPCVQPEDTMIKDWAPGSFPKDVFPCHPSGDPFLYTGRFDMLGNVMGRPVVRDEKTTGGSITDKWADQWNLRSQFIGYTWACREGGIPVDSVYVRGISILKTKLTFQEIEKVYSDELRTRWLEQVRRDLWRIRKAWDEDYFDFNFADACTQYGLCTFMDVCHAPQETADAFLSNFEIRHWNPLLKDPTAATAEVEKTS